MIPTTKNGLDPYVCLSALQKHIRRGNELEAMRVAVELSHTSKAFHSMVCKRLQVIQPRRCRHDEATGHRAVREGCV